MGKPESRMCNLWIAWIRWVVKRGKNNKGRMLLVHLLHLRRSGSSPRATQRTRMRDSRMSEGEKEGPARQRRTAHPRVVNRPARPGKGNAGPSSYRSVVRINYMDNSLGTWESQEGAPHAGRNYAQQFTVDRLFREPSIETCGT